MIEYRIEQVAYRLLTPDISNHWIRTESFLVCSLAKLAFLRSFPFYRLSSGPLSLFPPKSPQLCSFSLLPIMETKGQLIAISQLRATLPHNVGWFRKKDPICEITLGSQCVKTTPCWDEGLKPVWTESFTLLRTHEAEINFCVLNRSNIGIRHLVASGSFTFLDYPVKGLSCTILLTYEDVLVGELEVLLTFVGHIESSSNPKPPVLIIKQMLEDELICNDEDGGCQYKKRLKNVIIDPCT